VAQIVVFVNQAAAAGDERNAEAEALGDKSPKPPIGRGGEENPDFAAFWVVYPRRVQKADARKAFAKAIKKTSLESLVESVKSHVETVQWQKDSGQFIPYPASWLNSEGWLDDPAPVKCKDPFGTVRDSRGNIAFRL